MSPVESGLPRWAGPLLRMKALIYVISLSYGLVRGSVNFVYLALYNGTADSRVLYHRSFLSNDYFDIRCPLHAIALCPMKLLAMNALSLSCLRRPGFAMQIKRDPAPTLIAIRSKLTTSLR